MMHKEISNTELTYIEKQTALWLEEINEKHDKQAQASSQIGLATRAAIVDREDIDVTDAVRTLIGDPSLTAFKERGAAPHPDVVHESETMTNGDKYGVLRQALPVEIDIISYVKDSAPFADVNSHVRVTGAAWANANSDSELKAGNFGGDCGFFVPGGEGWVSSWANFGPITPDIKAKKMVVGCRFNVDFDSALVATLGYANTSSKSEVSVFDIVHKEEVMRFSWDRSNSWAVVGGAGGKSSERFIEHIQFNVKPGARYFIQFRHTQTSGGGGLIVGGHNKDQLKSLVMEFIQLK